MSHKQKRCVHFMRAVPEPPELRSSSSGGAVDVALVAWRRYEN